MRSLDFKGRMPRLAIASTIVLCCFVRLLTAELLAAEPRLEPAKTAERPWAAVWISSLAATIDDRSASRCWI